MIMLRSRAFLRGVLLFVLLGLGLAVRGRWVGWFGGAAESPQFAGSAVCASCHPAEFAAWRGSQHAVAMQEATPGAVLGRFDSTKFSRGGVVTTFLRRGGRFVVNTEGPDGTLKDLDIRYTFGVWPLQQYLVEFSGGRIQPLSLAWDARTVNAGGQRWFSLDSEPRVPPTDESHWTGRASNWNFMCADCHSTAVRKGYDATADTFHTTFAEINVACEACHAPGSAHVSWGRAPAFARRLLWRTNGLVARLDERHGVGWSIDPATRKPRRSVPRQSDREIDICAQCHALRMHIADGYVAGRRIFDYYDPMLLVPPLYHADGQQKDEAYTYASFLQSRMYSAGVTCADCHDPHSQKLRSPGNAVCAQCHLATKYDTVAHHGHDRESAGAACASCHMPTTTYMQVDPRHDHSLRVPRPDLTLTLGVPNACQQCHADRGARWATERVRAWLGRDPVGFQRFAGAFTAAARGDTGGADSLAAVAGDSTQPAIVRASALARLASWPGSVALGAARAGGRDASPLVRRGTLELLKGFPPNERTDVAAPLLSDSTRAVRQEAALVLVSVRDSLATPEMRSAFATAAAEYIASQRYNADRAESRTSLGAFLFARGEVRTSAEEFRAAASLWPHYVDAWVDLAGALSALGREGEGEVTLRDALRTMPEEPRLHHALGLSLARSGRLHDAVLQLSEATRLSSSDPEYAYPYAVVLHGMRRGREAIRVLDASLARSPTNRDLLFALASYEQESGDIAAALRHARQLNGLYPDDPEGRSLLGKLEARAR